MSVTMMVGADRAGLPNVEKIDYPGCKSPIYMATTHVGLVIFVGEHNGYNDSDFYAIVWNPATGCPEEIEYGTTRAWTYPNHAEVDATPEVRAAYDAWVIADAERLRKIREAIDSKKPGMGKRVRVVRGRKVPLGTEGVIFWMREETYSPRFKNGCIHGPDTIKIGIAVTDEKDARGRYVNAAWTYVSNVEVVA